MKLPLLLALLATLPTHADEPLTPIDQLGAGQYRGHTGGLYAGGKNEPHSSHASALKARCAEIRPLDAAGKPAADGSIVIAGVGASVCRQIFQALEHAGRSTPDIHPAVKFVNCAVGGADFSKLADDRYWAKAQQALAAQNVTAAQVQVVWFQSDDLRDSRDDFPGRPQRLQLALAEQMKRIATHFPNARLCYHSARHTTAFMPGDEGKAKHAEPRPYHMGWAVKWLIESPDNGRDGTPLATWAGYFWTDGEKPRADGHRWTRDMNAADGVHLSETGQRRVAAELCEFWRRDAFAKTWFTSAATAPIETSAAAASPRVFTYQAGGPRPLQLRAYLPPGWKPADQRPALLLFQGGSYSPTAKNERPAAAASTDPRFGRIVEPMAAHFAALGWVCLHVDCRSRQRDGASVEDAMGDAFAALRWARAHAGALGIAPARIAASGVSSGGHLAASLAVLADPAGGGAPEPPMALVLHSPLLDFVEGGTRDVAFLEAVENDRARGERLSPARRWRATAPPTLILAGEREPVFTSLRDFAAQRTAAGQRVEFAPFHGGHGGSLKDEALPETLARMEAFLKPLAAVPAPRPGLKPQVAAAQALKPGEPALLINGRSKFAKLERLLATGAPVRMVVYAVEDDRALLSVEDVFRQRVDLNERLGAREVRIHFLGADGQRLPMTQAVPDVVRLK